MAEQHDVVIVGGGHNGLVAAAYLAKAGYDVLVLERRYVIGGACVTEELFPGFKVSIAAQIGGLLKHKIVRDLNLEKFGYRLMPYDPQRMHLFPDGRYLQFWQDPAKTKSQIEKFSSKDAIAYLQFERLMDRLASIIKPLELHPPPSLGELEARFRDAGEEESFRQVMFGTMKDFVDSRFESEELKVAVAVRGMTGIAAGPMSQGSAYMMLHYWPEPGVSWGGVPGGMGALTQALGQAAEYYGATIRTESEVARIIVSGEKATGVELLDGSIIEAKVLASNADPKRTFLNLLEPMHLDEGFRHQVAGIRTEGVALNLHFALDGLPEFKAHPGKEPGPQHNGIFWICPSLDSLERAWDDAKYGHASREPYLAGIIHSAMDPTVAPPGKHYMTVYGQWAPYHLRDSTWEMERDVYARHCIDVLADYLPNLKDIIIDYQLLSPKDLEDRLYLTDGHMFHGESTVGQLFGFRPVPGWANYRTPISHLYLCGAGTHPGGTVTGAPGHNAAQEIINDWREGIIE